MRACARRHRAVLVRQLEVPDPHLYFQAPGGQCLRLVGLDEDLSFYEGKVDGPDVGRIKVAPASWKDVFWPEIYELDGS